MNKDIYINDLLNRYPGYSFTETPRNDLITIAFLDNEGNEQAAATKEMSIDAYRAIRTDMLGMEPFAFLSSTSERNALGDMRPGLSIYNVNKKRTEAFDGSKWNSVAGSGVMDEAAYGGMYQDLTAGYTIGATGIWNNAREGVLDASGFITFANRSELIVNEGAAGDYEVSYNANATSSMSSNVYSHLRINGVDVERIKDAHQGDDVEMSDMSAGGIITIVEGDIITLHVSSGDLDQGDVVKVYQVNVNIRRIS